MPSKLVLDVLSNLDDTGKINFASNLSLDLSGVTRHILLPEGTTDQRPENPTPGSLRWNTTDNLIDFYTSTGWKQVSVEEDYDNLVRSGLTLYVDTFDRDSYFGVGTSWSNLSKFIIVQPELKNGIILQQSSNSFTFNAVDQYAFVQSDFSTPVMTDGTATTYSFWFRADSGLNYGTGNSQKILFSILDASDNTILKIGVVPSGGGIYYADNATSGVVGAGTDYNNDTWYNLTIVRPYGSTGQTSTFYINGTSIGTLAGTNPTYSLGAYVSICGVVGGTLSQDFYGGNLSFVSVYERNLSLNELVSNYEFLKYRYGY